MIRSFYMLCIALFAACAVPVEPAEAGYWREDGAGGGVALTWEDLADQGAVLATRDVYGHANGAITYSGTTLIVPLSSAQNRASTADSYTSEWAVPASMLDTGGLTLPGTLHWKITDTGGDLAGTDFQVGFGWTDVGTSKGGSSGMRFLAGGTAQAGGNIWTAAYSLGASIATPTVWQGSTVIEGSTTAGGLCQAGGTSAVLDGFDEAVTVSGIQAAEGKRLALVIGHYGAVLHTITPGLRVQFAFQPLQSP